MRTIRFFASPEDYFIQKVKKWANCLWWCPTCGAWTWEFSHIACQQTGEQHRPSHSRCSSQLSRGCTQCTLSFVWYLPHYSDNDNVFSTNGARSWSQITFIINSESTSFGIGSESINWTRTENTINSGWKKPFPDWDGCSQTWYIPELYTANDEVILMMQLKVD